MAAAPTAHLGHERSEPFTDTAASSTFIDKYHSYIQQAVGPNDSDIGPLVQHRVPQRRPHIVATFTPRHSRTIRDKPDGNAWQAHTGATGCRTATEGQAEQAGREREHTRRYTRRARLHEHMDETGARVRLSDVVRCLLHVILH